MRARRQRLVATAVLTSYVLAVTIGTALHVHGDHRRALCAAQVANLAVDDLLARNGLPSPDYGPRCWQFHAGDNAGSCGTGSAEWCAVCHFLAQKLIPADHVETAPCADPVGELRTAEPVRWDGGAVSSRHIRGPPALA